MNSNQFTAKTGADTATDKQLIAIRAISRAHGLNAELICGELMGCPPERLSRKAAGYLIEHLKGFRPASFFKAE